MKPDNRIRSDSKKRRSLVAILFDADDAALDKPKGLYAGQSLLYGGSASFYNYKMVPGALDSFSGPHDSHYPSGQLFAFHFSFNRANALGGGYFYVEPGDIIVS